VLAAEGRAGASVHRDLQVEPRALDVRAEPAVGARLRDGLEQAAVDVQHLATQVDERVVAADRVGRDDDALDERVGRVEHRGDVLARARLRLVGVDDEVAGTAVRRRQEAPLHARGEARAAAAAQTGVLDGLDDVGGIRLERLGGGLVAAVLGVRVEGPRLLEAPRRGQDGRQLGHVPAPFQPWDLATSTPASVAAPAPWSSSARPSSKPASTRDISLKVTTLSAPRVGRIALPSRMSSTSWRAFSGVMLSKNSQLTIITGA